MSTGIAAGAAVLLSVGALLACMIALPMTFNKVQNIRADLRSGMDTFDILYQDAWKEMVAVRTAVPRSRQARQVGCRKFYKNFYSKFFVEDWKKCYDFLILRLKIL